MPGRGLDARRRVALAGLPAQPPSARRRGLHRAWARADRRARARVLPRRARPVLAGRPAPLRRRAVARVHGRRGVRSARGRPADAPLVRRARARGVRREPRVHELAVRDQPEALGRTRRRRPGVHAQGRGEGDRDAGGSARDVHGPAVHRPGRLRLPRPSLAERRGRRERIRRRHASGRAEPARGVVRRRSDRRMPRGCRRSSARRSTRTSGSSRTASRRPTRTGGTTTAPRSAVCRGSAARAPGSRCARATDRRTRT